MRGRLRWNPQYSKSKNGRKQGSLVYRAKSAMNAFNGDDWSYKWKKVYKKSALPRWCSTLYSFFAVKRSARCPTDFIEWEPSRICMWARTLPPWHLAVIKSNQRSGKWWSSFHDSVSSFVVYEELLHWHSKCLWVAWGKLWSRGRNIENKLWKKMSSLTWVRAER